MVHAGLAMILDGSPWIFRLPYHVYAERKREGKKGKIAEFSGHLIIFDAIGH
jgi:hypothetical protein